MRVTIEYSITWQTLHERITGQAEAEARAEQSRRAILAWLAESPLKNERLEVIASVLEIDITKE